jgi:hypothetical protein
MLEIKNREPCMSDDVNTVGNEGAGAMSDGLNVGD